MESAVVTCADGWRLAVDVVMPEDAAAPEAVVIAGHAMMVDRRTLDARGDGLVSELARHRLAVVWPDLRGHGRSGPLAAEGGRWSYDDLVEQDSAALIAWTRARFPGLTVGAIGHSLYAHVTVAHLSRHPDAPLSGVVLLGGNVWLRRHERSLARWLKKRAILEATVAIGRAVGYVPARRLRVGPTNEALDYFAQFTEWLRADDWHARDGYSYSANMGRIAVPILSIAGAGDRLEAVPSCVADWIAPVPGHEHVVAGRGGAPGVAIPLAFDPDHMQLVTDGRSRPIWRAAADFLRRAAGLPPVGRG